MQHIIIDVEFKALLPALDEETFTQLEQNILQYGVRDPVVLWNGILIDGHNRYAICQKHDLPFHTVDMEFDTREEVLIWIISTQVSRRNLTPMQLSYFRGLHYRADKIVITNANGNNQHNEVDYQNDNQPKKTSTAKKLADKYNVSPITIIRDAKLSETIDEIGKAFPEAKVKILSGEVSINKNVLQEHASKPKEEISEIATKIEEGTYEKRTSETPATNNSNTSNQNNNVIQKLNNIIIKATDDINTELKNVNSIGERVESKIAIQTFINTLEGIYKGL